MFENRQIFLNDELQSEEENFFRYSMILEYIGSGFAGSQKQLGSHIKTVQSEVENALKQLLQRDVKVIFSGRTDKGVHARNQTVHFNLPLELNIKRFLYSLNAILPENISVKSVAKVDKNFHSQKSAKYRWYRYYINNCSQRSVWLDKTHSHVYTKLDVEAMQLALGYLVGKHDFSSFKSVNSANPAKECTMYYAVCKEKSGIIKIDLIANRFLYNMVRIITGTLIEIGKGIYPPDQMLKILETKDRKCAGRTAEACGLTLMYVGYDEKYNLQNGCNNTNINYDLKTCMETEINENIFCKAS